MPVIKSIVQQVFTYPFVIRVHRQIATLNEARSLWRLSRPFHTPKTVPPQTQFSK